MNKDSKIYIAGHKGLVGSAIHRKLIKEGYTNLVFKTSHELDLREGRFVDMFFERERPEYVFLVAAKVGGVLELSKHGAESLYSNILLQTNVIHSAYKYKVKKLLFLGSNCLYPRLAPQPLKEEVLMAGKLEETTEYYAIAKLSGIKMCEAYRKQYDCNFITALPVNLYGENDTYNLIKSHVLPALLMKFHDAKINNLPNVEVWGSGNQKREFLYVDDVADACLFLMLNYNDKDPVNIGSGEDITIGELALIIKDIVGYEGELVFNREKPEGISGKLLDVSKINKLGWINQISLANGIKMAYEKFKQR